MSKIFSGCSFVLELGSLPLREKNHIKYKIQENGGLIHHVLTQQTTCLVCTETNENDSSFKIRTAQKFRAAIITTTYLLDCVRKEKSIDRLILAFDGKIAGVDTELELLQEYEERAHNSLAIGVQNIAFVAVASLSPDAISTLHKPLSLLQIAKRFYKSAQSFDDAHPTNSLRIFYQGNIKSAAQIRQEKEKEYQLRYIEEGIKTLNLEKQYWKEKKAKEKRQQELAVQKEIEERHIREAEEKQKKDYQLAILQEKKEKEERDSAEADNILSRLRALASDVSAPALVGKKWLALHPLSLEDKKNLATEAKEIYSEILFPNSQTVVTLCGDPEENSSENKKDSTKRKVESMPSFCDVVRKSLGLPLSVDAAEEKEEAKPIISFAGFKIFYGGIKFADIDAMADNDSPWSAAQIENIKNERKLLFLATYCEKFGNVVEVQEHWDEGYIFVVFDNKADSKNVLDTLRDFKTRKALAREARAQLIASGKEKLITPDHTFYVRWPNFYKRILRQKKDKKNKKPPKQSSQTDTNKQVKNQLKSQV